MLVAIDLIAHGSGIITGSTLSFITYWLLPMLLVGMVGVCWIALSWYRSARLKVDSYEKLVQQMGEGIAIVDLDENFVYANPATERIFGVRPGDLIGRNIRSFIAEDSYQDIRQQTALRLKNVTSSYELVISSESGERRYVRVTASPELDDQGNICGSYGLIQDITERRQAEEALRQLNAELEQRVEQRAAELSRSEERYRALVELSPEAITVIADDRIAYANQAAAQLFGAPSIEALTGCSIGDFFAPERWKTVTAKLKQPPEQLDYEILVEELTRLDGSHCIVESRIAPISYQNEPALLFLATDITERQRAERALRESEERFRTLVESMPDGLVVQNPDQRITYVNQSFCNMLGYDSSAMVGHLITDFLDTANETILIEQTGRRQQGSREQYELSWIHQAGRVVTTLVSPAPIFDEGGTFQASFAVIKDITEEKRSAQLERKHWQLLDGIATVTNLLVSADETEEAINQTLAVIGHAAGADRVHLFANGIDPSTGEPCFRHAAEWTREGIRATRGPDTDDDCIRYSDLLPNWYEDLSLGRPVMRKASTCPTIERAQCESRGIKSLLAVPVLLGSETWGFIGLDDCQQEREWLDSEITTLLAVASSIGGFIAKARAEEQREQLIVELREALAQIKALRGLLPICSYCKKIRDDKGYWNQIEAYVAEHSEAEFSHGICPDCMEKHFPQLQLSPQTTSDVKSTSD
jgi:PAS domain S-box-containing protein